MAASKQRRRSRQIRLATLFVGCVLLVDALFGDHGFYRMRRSRQDLLRAGQEIAELRRQNAALRIDVQRLEHDPATLELVARQELGLLRRGEILVVLSGVK
jgi:cell division protein FtsB